MSDSQQKMMVFVSHAGEDNAFCQALVEALRRAGADVWYDEQNLGAGHVRRVIMQELVRRPVFVVVLSKAALTSKWVMDECDWAYDLQRDEPSRILLPVVAEPLQRADFNAALHLHSLKRVEAPGMQPFPTDEAIHRVLQALTLTPAGETSASPTAQPNRRGAASFQQMLASYEQAVALYPNSVAAWLGKATWLTSLRRYDEALAACERAIALDPNSTNAWAAKAAALRALGRTGEAEVAARRVEELRG